MQTRRKLMLMTQESIKDILNKHIQKSKKKQPKKPDEIIGNPRMTVVDNSFDNKLSDPQYLQIYKQMLKTYYQNDQSNIGLSKFQEQGWILERLEQLRQDVKMQIACVEEQNMNLLGSHEEFSPKIEELHIQQPNFSTSHIHPNELRSVTRILAEDESLSVTDKEMLAYALVHSTSQNNMNKNDITLEDLINSRSSKHTNMGTTPNKSHTLNLSSTNSHPSVNLTTSQCSALNNARLDSIKEEDDLFNHERLSEENRFSFTAVSKKGCILGDLKNDHQNGKAEDVNVSEITPIHGIVQESIEDYGSILRNMKKPEACETESKKKHNSSLIMKCETEKKPTINTFGLITPLKMPRCGEDSPVFANSNQKPEPNFNICNEGNPNRDSKEKAMLFCLQSSPIELKTTQNNPGVNNPDLSFASGIIEEIEEEYHVEKKKPVEVKKISSKKGISHTGPSKKKAASYCKLLGSENNKRIHK